MPKRIRKLLSAAALAAAASGCLLGGDEGPSEHLLVGSWEATEWVRTSKGDLGSVELVALGGSMKIVLRDDGTAAYRAQFPDGSEQVLDWAWWVEEDELHLAPPGVTDGSGITWSVELLEDTLLLTGADAAWDFDGDSVWDPAEEDVKLTRITE
jgi:hypothetical protein